MIIQRYYSTITRSVVVDMFMCRVCGGRYKHVQRCCCRIRLLLLLLWLWFHDYTTRTLVMMVLQTLLHVTCHEIINAIRTVTSCIHTRIGTSGTSTGSRVLRGHAVLLVTVTSSCTCPCSTNCTSGTCTVTTP